MDIKLESLIAKIKRDGVEEAKRAYEDTIQEAKSEAEAIIEEAKAQAKKIEEQARAAADKLKSNSQDSLRQASRDIVLTVKQEIISLFDRILKGKAGEALSAEFMAELIAKMIDKWKAPEGAAWEVLVSKSDKEKVEKALKASLRKKAEFKVEIKASRAVDKGFRVGIKGDDLHYDFTDQSILEALKEFLNPSLAAILDANNG